jgi:hypothetical protein
MSGSTPAPITKIEAARRQLGTAIELFFSQGDPIVIATLAYNALEITATLASREGKEDWTAFVEVAAAHGSTPREVRKIFHAPRNFFKHADRDPDEVLEKWDDEDTAHLLTLTVLQFGEVAERSVEMWSMLIWYYSSHPELRAPEGALRDIVQEFAYVATLNRGQQLAQRAIVLEELRRRAKD